MQGAEERRLRRMNNTLQACREPLGRTRGVTEGNPPEADKRSSLDPALRGDDTLMMDQG